jgi:putative nucleotidyltransferase with HDIG domain
MERFKKILARIDRLPALPGVVSEVLDITSDINFDSRKLVAVVALDPGITINVLRRANSAYFGLGHKAVTLQQALMRIGVTNLIDIAISSGVVTLLDSDLAGYQAPRGALWRHSLAAALVARSLAQSFKLGQATELYTAALLHDVGKIILSAFVAEEMSAIEDLMERERWPMIDAERKVLGVDHAQLGGMAAKRWKLGENIQSAIRFHHRPEDAMPNRDFANVVSLSNYLANVLGVNCGQEEPYLSLPPALLFDLGLTGLDLDRLKTEMDFLLKKAEPLFELAGV